VAAVKGSVDDEQRGLTIVQRFVEDVERVSAVSVDRCSATLQLY